MRRRDCKAPGGERGDAMGGLQQSRASKVCLPLLVPLSGLLPEFLTRAWGWQTEAAQSRHRCRRICPAPAEPPRGGTHRPGERRAGHPPARAGCERRWRGGNGKVQTASSYLSPPLAPQTGVWGRWGRLRLGPPPPHAGPAVVCGSMGIWPLVPAAAGRGLCFLYKKRHN